MAKTSNFAKGTNSYDINIGNSLINFFNRNVTPYPTESGSPSFDLVPVTKQKDLMVNAARIHAKQEYDRIMELVSVLQKQAEEIKRRLDITDMVCAAKYEFQTYPGQCYWLVFDTDKQFTRLVSLGPNDWCTAPPKCWEYIMKIKWLGDYTWVEVTD